MHVAVGTDQSRDRNPIAADVFDEITEDGKTGDDVEARLRVQGRSAERYHQCRQKTAPEKNVPTSHRTPHASR